MAQDVEAAYFALLRAREDETDLQRYGEYLHDEVRRLRRVRSELDAAAGDAPGRLRRRIAHTDGALSKALQVRLEVVDEELARLDQRVDDARAYVAECEHTHAALRAAAGES